MTTNNVNVLVPTTGTPVHPVGAYATSFQVANTGANEIFIGQDSSVSISSGLPLQPGGSTTWQAGTDLWAVAAAGLPSQVTCLFSSEGSYSPGQANVTINGPVTNPNAPELLGSNTVIVPNALGQVDITPANLAAIDLTPYSCLIVTVVIGPAATAGDSASNFISCNLNQVSAAGLRTDKTDAEWLFSPPGSAQSQVARIKVPVTGTGLTGNIIVHTGILHGSSCTLTASVYGSQETLNGPEYVHQNDTLTAGNPSGAIALLDNSSVAGGVTAFIESVNGDSDLNFFKGANTATSSRVSVNQLSNGVSNIIARGRLETAAGLGANVQTSFNAPMRPLSLGINNETAALTQDFTATISQ